MDDPLLAANHFVGPLLWIPVNKAMFTGDQGAGSQAGLERYAEAAVRAFLSGYGPQNLAGTVKGLPKDLAVNPKYMEGFGR